MSTCIRESWMKYPVVLLLWLWILFLQMLDLKKKKSQTEPNKPFFHHATSFFPFLKTNITFSNKSIECVAVLYKHQLQILITYFSVVFVVFSLNAVLQFFPVFTCDSVTLTFCVSSPLSAAFLNYFCSINRGRSNFS